MLEDIWIDLEDAIEGVPDSGSDISAAHINLLARHIIELEKTGGKNGLSAYEIAVQNGFEGTETEWLESLKGEQGVPGEKGDPYELTEADRTEIVNDVLDALPNAEGVEF